MCTLLDATQRYDGRIRKESEDSENGAETERRKISKGNLLKPPSAESCPEGTLQVCVGKGQEGCRGIEHCPPSVTCHLQGADVSELEL